MFKVRLVVKLETLKLLLRALAFRYVRLWPCNAFSLKDQAVGFWSNKRVTDCRRFKTSFEISPISNSSTQQNNHNRRCKILKPRTVQFFLVCLNDVSSSPVKPLTRQTASHPALSKPCLCLLTLSFENCSMSAWSSIFVLGVCHFRRVRKTAKSDESCIMSVCLSVRPSAHNQHPTGRIFMKFSTEYLSKKCPQSKTVIKLRQEQRHFTSKPNCIYANISLNYS
jgi:phage FluMu protein Com